MSSCGRFQRLLLRQEDGSLGWPGRVLLRRHLSRCPACRSFAEDASRISQAGPELEPVSARTVAAIRDAARRAIAGRSEPEERLPVGSSVAVPALAAAAAVLVLVIVEPPFRGGPAGAPPQIGTGIGVIFDGPAPRETVLPEEADRATLDDHIDDLEDLIRCLDTQLDESIWNAYR